MYLVDTNILSAGASASTSLSIGSVSRNDLLAWMDAASDRLFLSVVTVTEIEAGIAKAARQGATRKAADLAEWLDALVHLYGTRILPVDPAIARLAGKLADVAQGGGFAPGTADILIAATGMRHGLVILTRNFRHFGPLGVAAINPFETLPTS